MRRTAKVAISLPAELLRDIENERRASGESRSQFLRRAAEAEIRRQRERAAIQQYIRGYERDPEAAEEIAFSESTASAALADSPWEVGKER